MGNPHRPSLPWRMVLTADSVSDNGGHLSTVSCLSAPLVTPLQRWGFFHLPRDRMPGRVARVGATCQTTTEGALHWANGDL